MSGISVWPLGALTIGPPTGSMLVTVQAMTFSQHFRYRIETGASVPFAELRSLVDEARAAGAVDDTPVVAVALQQDAEVADYLEVQLDSSAVPAAERPVLVDRSTLRDLRDLLATLSTSDGDIRSAMPDMRDAHATLVDLADDVLPPQPA